MGASGIRTDVIKFHLFLGRSTLALKEDRFRMTTFRTSVILRPRKSSTSWLRRELMLGHGILDVNFCMMTKLFIQSTSNYSQSVTNGSSIVVQSIDECFYIDASPHPYTWERPLVRPPVTHPFVRSWKWHVLRAFEFVDAKTWWMVEFGGSVSLRPAVHPNLFFTTLQIN